jgi:hypothetical protein
MAYAFVEDVPANTEIYGKIRAQLPADVPNGLLAHVAFEIDGGLRYVDVWETKEQWEAFREETLEPTVGKVLAEYGLPHDHSLVQFDEVPLVHLWQPA